MFFPQLHHQVEISPWRILLCEQTMQLGRVAPPQVATFFGLSNWEYWRSCPMNPMNISNGCPKYVPQNASRRSNTRICRISGRFNPMTFTRCASLHHAPQDCHFSHRFHSAVAPWWRMLSLPFQQIWEIHPKITDFHQP